MPLKHPLVFMILLVSFMFISPFSLAQAPDFKLSTLDGKTVTLSEFAGKVVYVDFWATWCPPCRRSFPWMEKMYQKYNDHGLEIIAISLDGKNEVIERFIAIEKPSFIIARDRRSKIADKFKVRAMPTSFIIDRDGDIYYVHRGFNREAKAKLEEKLRDLLLN
jgi:thiol-disulfide isomerase/thioredoxin